MGKKWKMETVEWMKENVEWTNENGQMSKLTNEKGAWRMAK